MRKAKLTKRAVDALAPEDKLYIVWDTVIPGFGVRVMPSGVKTYLLQFRVGRSRSAPVRKPSIGRHGPVTADKAREVAQKWRGLIADGLDPTAARRETRPTMQDLRDDYMERHAGKKRTGKEDQRRFDRNVLLLDEPEGGRGRRTPKWDRKKAPKLRKMAVADVTTRHIEDLHRAMASAPLEANRTLALLSKAFRLAVRWGWRDDNPTVGVERYDEGQYKRERYLTVEELQKLFAAMIGHDDQVGCDIVRLAILTGARRGEVLKARPEQFDLQAATWTKPSAHTKTKKTHKIPLSAPALQLVERLDRHASGWFFPGQKDGEHRQDVRKTWEELCEAASIEGCRFHDLRHTFASVIVSGGGSLPLIGTLLGHTQPATTQRYAHLMDDPLRRATEKAAKTMTTPKREKRKSAKVLKLR